MSEQNKQVLKLMEELRKVDLAIFEWEEHNKTAKTWVVGKDGKGHWVEPKEKSGKY